MIVIDSEFESLIPPLADDEYQRLEQSILNEGFHDWEPIVTWNGTIIDGHNRYKICDEHGIKFTTQDMQFESRDAAKIWIIEHQFGRRNLKPYDRSVLALKLEPLYAAEAKRRQATSTGGAHPQLRQNSDKAAPIRTDERVAKAAGVSRDTIRKVKIIETEANDGNDTAIKAREEVQKSKKSIHKAYLDVRPKADKTDTRPLCVICGKPVDEDDCYDHNPNKHKSCASKDIELHRGSRGGRKGAQYTEDGKRICTYCGKPIDEGDSYNHHPSKHKKCFNKSTQETRYANPDKMLIENVAVYNTESLVNELLGSVELMRTAVSESIAINQSMGVDVSKQDIQRIAKAIDGVVKAIERMKGQ